MIYLAEDQDGGNGSPPRYLGFSGNGGLRNNRACVNKKIIYFLVYFCLYKTKFINYF